MPKNEELEKNVENKVKNKKKSTEVSAKNTKNTTSKKTTQSAKKTATKKTSTKQTDVKKNTSKTSTTKKTESKPKTSTTKKVENKTNTKNSVVKKDVKKTTPNNKKVLNKKAEEPKAKKVEEVKVEKEVKKVESKKANEETIIEKIKNFIAKIVAMQEEAAREEAEGKDSKGAKRIPKKEKNIFPAKPDYLLEYYDLPYRYNETVVKILAQTPKRLFVYWDISDKDREKYLKTFGEDFFDKTYPVLLLYNEDKKYIKEIPINDFANSWYINIEDSKNKYTIQLGRKFKDVPEIVNMATFEEEHIILRTDYLPFADSNKLEVPNDHVLLECLPRFLTFRNVKTNQETVRELKSFKDVFGQTYNVKNFYDTEYKEELAEGVFDMANPSSNLSSSSFK